ncbi:MAG: NUDIX hydrolase [Opitutaceae bacterium]|jgi:8-oxo-dGTP pyrophosphatase MutT (NUDIX family)|nr:NUDIX hydrolase [Opitutaceae bacterium]
MNDDATIPDNEPKLLHATRWLSLYQRGRWIYASRRKAGEPARIDGLNIIAFHETPATGDGDSGGTGGGGSGNPGSRMRRRLVVIEEWRVPVQAWEFALPAGLLEPGETPEACAERELAEETGLALTWTGARSGTLFSSPGMSDETLAFITVGCKGAPAENPGVDGEQIRAHLLDREDCRALLARNARGEAVLSSRLWPVLFAIAETGAFGGWEIGQGRVFPPV